MQLPTYRLSAKSPKKDFIFNMFGYTAMSLVSVVLLMIVSYIKGEEVAGIFSLSYSTAYMMYTVAMFETRTVQVTDTERNFSLSDFMLFRILTVLLMLTASAAFVIIKGFSPEKIILTLIICVYMALLAVSDIFQGSLHLNGYLKNAGFSLGAQVLLAAAGFTVSLLITGNVFVSSAVMAAIVLIWILVYDMPFARNFGSLVPKSSAEKLKKLFLATAPLFISVFINQYNFNTPKYAIDRYLTEVDQSHYGYLVMPAFIINLMSMFMFRPQMVPLSEKWASKNYKGFGKTVLMLYGWIIAVLIAALCGGWLLGIPVLNLLYHTNLNEYRALFMILLIGGGFSAGSSLTIVLLAVIRKQRHALIAYISAFVIALFVPNLLVKNYGFTGAIFAYLVITSSLFILLFAVFLICLKTSGKVRANETQEDENAIHG
jgi:O-antigen/teichoic acid export membrane protein